jgi:4-phospho-D-threonate 3-dehydrogenase / 4-phospho-D-erythronate 3-dehydrogenase
MNRPTVAVTMGDPAGIGPEIVVRALAEPAVREACCPVVIGDPGTLKRALALVKAPMTLRVVSTAAGAGADPGTLDLIAGGELPEGAPHPGTLDRRSGEAAAACCRRAVALAQAGEASGITSTPFNKEAFHLAGYKAMDDMTYFQECFGSSEAYMVGEVADLWVTPVTFHVSFREIPGLITMDAVLTKIRKLHAVMEAGGISPLNIGVAGLNVHCGEGGMFGREEIEFIGPAIARARAEGYAAAGPVPPDSLFPNALRGDYRGIVCMYHDQANIGRKILGLERPGVTLFLGMPAPVVTVPHGTAYDIAWKGTARHAMLVRAITTAAAMAGKSM